MKKKKKNTLVREDITVGDFGMVFHEERQGNQWVQKVTW